MTEVDTQPAVDRFDAAAPAGHGLAGSDDPLARRYRGRLHGALPRRARHARQRVAPELPCQRHDPELWFAEAPADLERAKALCVACPVRLTCLAIAVEGREYAGVWGGQIFDRGRIVPHKRPRGRPRKHNLRPEPGPFRPDESAHTSQASAPHGTSQIQFDAVLRNLHDAESAVHAAHRSRLEASITAANTRLRDAVTEYLATITAQHRPPPGQPAAPSHD